MKYSFYRKLTLTFSIIGSMFLASCGSSSGGDDYEFTNLDFTNKYWYADNYLDDSYNTNDEMIVYLFESGNVLKRQQFSGRRNILVGEWSLVDNKLILEDKMILGGVVQEWTILPSSSKNELKLKRLEGGRNFYTNLEKFTDITADAYIVNELRKVDGIYKSAYRYECKVYGQDVDKSRVMFSDEEDYDLVKISDFENKSLFVLSDSDGSKYFDELPGEKQVKFYLELEGNEPNRLKLDETIYSEGIASLDEVKSYTIENGSISVEWNAIDEDDVFYYVEILGSDRVDAVPFFRSNRQPASADQVKILQISNSTGAEINRLSELESDMSYYLRITGVKYEDGIDAINSGNNEINIQAKTVFTYKFVW